VHLKKGYIMHACQQSKYICTVQMSNGSFKKKQNKRFSRFDRYRTESLVQADF
jgi:hypothetical protein